MVRDQPREFKAQFLFRKVFVNEIINKCYQILGGYVFFLFRCRFG
mgnify:CR=1 FL=1